MSRSIFSEELRQEGISKREHYEAVDLGFDESLVGEVLRWHVAEDPGEVPGGTRDYFEHCEEKVGRMMGDIPPEQFNSQAFLDTLVSRVELSGEDSFTTNYLFSPLMQHFYNQGHNALSLDLSGVERSYYFTMMRHLHGTEKKLLDLAFTGRDVHHCGSDTSHCRLAISGNVYVFGARASHSEFIYTGKRKLATMDMWHREWHENSDEATYSCLLGNVTEHCVFKLPDYVDGSCMSSFWGNSSVEIRIDLLKSDGTDDMCRVNEDFFEEGNQILISDGNGGWKEVTP